MQHFTRDYYIYNGEVYKKLHPTKKGYRLVNKDGKRVWITLPKILSVLAHTLNK